MTAEALSGWKKEANNPDNSWAKPRARFSVKIKEAEYDGENQLGTGATSIVFAADLIMEDGTYIPVALKVAKSAKSKGPVDQDTAESWIESLRFENTALDMLQKKQEELFPGTPSNFPAKQLIEINGKPALVLELIERANHIRKETFLSYTDKEERARSVIRQYMNVLETAFASNFNPSDRKQDDLYYYPENDRLVVLDWNVSGERGFDEQQKLKEQTKKACVAMGIKMILSALGNGCISQNDEAQYKKIFDRLVSDEDKITAKEAIALIREVKNISSDTGVGLEKNLTDSLESLYNKSMPQEKSTLEKMRERQVRLMAERTEKEKLLRFQKLDPSINGLEEENNENGQKIIIATSESGNKYKLSPDGNFELYNEAGKRISKGKLKPEMLETLGVKPKVETEKLSIQQTVEKQEPSSGRKPARPEVKSVPYDEVPTDKRKTIPIIPRVEVPIGKRETVKSIPRLAVAIETELEEMEREFRQKTGKSVDSWLETNGLSLKGIPVSAELLEKKIAVKQRKNTGISHDFNADLWLDKARIALAFLKERERRYAPELIPNMNPESIKILGIGTIRSAGKPLEITMEAKIKNPEEERREKEELAEKLRRRIEAAQKTMKDDVELRAFLILERNRLVRETAEVTPKPDEDKERLFHVSEEKPRVKELRQELDLVEKEISRTPWYNPVNLYKLYKLKGRERNLRQSLQWLIGKE